MIPVLIDKNLFHIPEEFAQLVPILEKMVVSRESLSHKVTLSPDQVKALTNEDFVELVPAVDGSFVVVDSITFALRFNSEPYQPSSWQVQFYYGDYETQNQVFAVSANNDLPLFFEESGVAVLPLAAYYTSLFWSGIIGGSVKMSISNTAFLVGGLLVRVDVNTDNPGSGYAVNDTGLILPGSWGATHYGTYKILAVSGGGVPTSVEVTQGGKGFPKPGNGAFGGALITLDTTANSGVGSGMKLDIAEVTVPGDSNLEITTRYCVV